METELESKCCKVYEELQSELDFVSDRISQHERLQGNCINPDVIEVSLYECIQANGPMCDEEPVHKVYRHIAYRRLARCIWHRLAKYERLVLPACAVNAIRTRFSSENYKGFEYA